MRAKNKQDITTQFWRDNINKIIEFNERPLLNHKGSISHAQMKTQVSDVYKEFNNSRKKVAAKHADTQDLEALKQLEAQIKKK